jgi:hypothetical protein
MNLVEQDKVLESLRSSKSDVLRKYKYLIRQNEKLEREVEAAFAIKTRS